MVWGSPVHWRVLNSIPGLYQLDVSGNTITTNDNQKSLQKCSMSSWCKIALIWKPLLCLSHHHFFLGLLEANWFPIPILCDSFESFFIYCCSDEKIPVTHKPVYVLPLLPKLQCFCTALRRKAKSGYDL